MHWTTVTPKTTRGAWAPPCYSRDYTDLLITVQYVNPFRKDLVPAELKAFSFWKSISAMKSLCSVWPPKSATGSESKLKILSSSPTFQCHQFWEFMNFLPSFHIRDFQLWCVDSCPCISIYLCVCVCPHLSWGALLHRFDDGHSVSLLQAEAIASITGSYLGKDMSKISKTPNTSTQRQLSQSTNTYTRRGHWHTQIAATVVFAHSSEKNAYWSIKWTFAVLWLFLLAAMCFKNDLLCLWIPPSCEDNIAKSEPIRQIES